MSSCSTLVEHALHPTTMETEIQKKRQADAKEFLRTNHFYLTNAGFPKELDGSKDEYTKSPLRSFQTLPPLEPPISERKLLRVSTYTTFKHTKLDQHKMRRKKKYNYMHPCYLVEYDKSTNQGVIFLGTSKNPDNPHRFAIVHSVRENEPHLEESLYTEPPVFFSQKKIYLNFSHPLRVRFAFFPSKGFHQIKIDEIPYDGHEPPFVAITNFATQLFDNDPREAFVVLNQESEKLFWKKHEEYHMDEKRLDKPRSKDDSGGVKPDDSGIDDDEGGGGDGPSTSGVEPNVGDVGWSSEGAGPSTSGARPNISDTRSNISGIGSSRGGFSSCKVEDAPWGRVGDLRIGLDIPLVIEDMYSDSDEEMDSEEPVINYNDAPWGRVGDLRIGLDIPLVIEDMYSDEEMDSELDEELQGDEEVDVVAKDVEPEEMDLKLDEELQEDEEVDVVAKDVEPESSRQKDIPMRSNPSGKESSWSYTISKPYFVISRPFAHEIALLDFDDVARRWRWTRKKWTRKRGDMLLSSEGLSYEYSWFFSFEYAGPNELIRRMFNWHTKEYIELPLHPFEPFNLGNATMGMIVDTSMQPYAFKVIEGYDKGTIIYDSITDLWTPRPSVPPKLSENSLIRNASVASCKGIVFMADRNNEIVLYDMEKDKWDHVQRSREHDYERLCGIGSWDDRVFSSAYCLSQYGWTFEIWELMGIDNPGWKKFDAMPRELYSWLFDGEGDSSGFMIDVSYCSENLLIWTGNHTLIKKFVLCNLARKTWKKLEPPPLTWEDHKS